MRFLKFMVYIIFLFVCKETNAQKQFTVQIQFPLNINKEQIKFFYDDGQNDNIDLKADIINGQVNLSKPFYSKYATIVIMHKDKSARFWVSDQAATISFTVNDSVSNPLQNFKLTNAYAIDNSDGAKK